MKKVILLVVTIATLLSLCACDGGNNTASPNDTSASSEVTTAHETAEPEVPLEVVSVEELRKDRGNGAKAQLNVGKGTTVIGKVTGITSDHCVVQLINPKNYTFEVILPLEVLADMNNNQFVAISAIVDSVDTADGDSPIKYATGTVVNTYILKADDISDSSLISTYIRDEIALIDSNYTDASSYFANITDALDMTLLKEYLTYNGSGFCVYKDADLKNYLAGEWFYNYAQYYSLSDQTVEFKDDGTYIWKFNTQTSGLKNWIDKEQDGDWSVSGASLDSVWDGLVYVLSEDAFICDNRLHTRIK